MSEREKMLAGGPYNARDPELTAARDHARATMARASAELDSAKRQEIYRELFGSMGEESFIEAPLFCDYGSNFYLGSDCFLNAHCVILDPGPVRLGDRVQCGPGVQLLTADHPREASRRAADEELSKPVTVGDDVWIGAGAIVCPGVTIGAASIIGAGSVVTRDVPAGVLAAGNPCRVIRELEDQA